MTMPPDDLLAQFSAIVGGRYAVRERSDQQPFVEEPRDRYHGRAALVLRPGSTAEVQQILALANTTRPAIVPQGGNTGLVGGQVPDGSGHQIVLSLARLNAIRAIDPIPGNTCAEAAPTPQPVREARESRH